MEVTVDKVCITLMGEASSPALVKNPRNCLVPVAEGDIVHTVLAVAAAVAVVVRLLPVVGSELLLVVARRVAAVLAVTVVLVAHRRSGLGTASVVASVPIPL